MLACIVEVEYARLYSEIGLGTTIWSPLASGILTGKYNDGIPEDSRLNLPDYQWLRVIRRLGKLANELGINMAQLALAWCLKNPNVSTVITGASRVEQVHSNMQALDVVPKLTDEVMQKIEDVLQNKPKQPQF
ncbi:MAG: hypothetical protein B6242_07330 [Anaerolineaceae bacterium 4572_78]|nr:MAG: hypothetical protein B6242_07330 [Anaerolineaceae bacterium 4572_78]